MSDTPEVGRIRLLLALRPEVESIGRRDALILAEAVATLTPVQGWGIYSVQPAT